MIICIFGQSCAGKTATAQRLATELGWPLRSCGTAVRERARELKIGIGELSDNQHRDVDAETVAWAIEQQNCLVEGRFLDAVFQPAEIPHVLVHLIASDAARVERCRARQGQNDLIAADNEDMSFRSRIFPLLSPREADLTVDTTGQSIDEGTQCILSFIQTKLPPLA